MKVKDIMSNSPLNINYNVTDNNGRRPFVPNKDEVTEAHALSAMYLLFWAMKSIESNQSKIDAILPLIDKGSLFPLPKSNKDSTLDESKQPKVVVDFVHRVLYDAIIDTAYDALPISIFYSVPTIRKNYRETFEKVRDIQLDASKHQYDTLTHPAIEPILEQTMLALHDHLVKLQEEIPLFIASKKDPRLLIVTQEELDYHSLYYSTLREESAMRLCQAFADTTGYEITFKSLKDNYEATDSPEDYARYVKELNELLAQLNAIAVKGIKAKSSPLHEGLITEQEYGLLVESVHYTLPEIWEVWLPERFFLDKLNTPQQPFNNLDQKIEGYLKTIAKQIEMYYCYYLTIDRSRLHRHSQPTHWFEFREKFNNNWRKPLKMIRSLVDLFDFKKPVFHQMTGINYPFFEYLWDPKLCQLKETWMYDEIVKEISTEGENIGSDEFTNMQTMFSPYNFVEEYGVPEAIKAQSKLGKSKVPSLTPFWNLDTGEYTRTTFMDNEQTIDGLDFITDRAVFQSRSTQPLISRKSRTTQQAPKLEDMTPDQREKAEIEAEEKQYLADVNKWIADNPERNKERLANNKLRLEALKKEIGMDESTPKPKPQGFGAKPRQAPAPPKPKKK
jgi:hypothetical protein